MNDDVLLLLFVGPFILSMVLIIFMLIKRSTVTTIYSGLALTAVGSLSYFLLITFANDFGVGIAGATVLMTVVPLGILITMIGLVLYFVFRKKEPVVR